MFSRFKKPEPASRNRQPSQSARVRPPTARHASGRRCAVNVACRRSPPSPQRSPAEVAALDKERKRKEQMSELKVELHKRLLDNLNLAALETASEGNLKSEIAAIAAEALDEMSVVAEQRTTAPS